MVCSLVEFVGGLITRRSWSWCLQFDSQLVRLHFDADDVVADEVSITAQCGVSEMLAGSLADASFSFGNS
jgi:hypothetical protein